MFELKESEGKRRGQRYIGATCQIVTNEGEKDVRFMTKDAEPRQMTFQCAPVNKMLGSVGGMTDANNAVLFMKDGGHILGLDDETLRKVKELVESCPQKTKFDRKGNVFVMEAYVRVPSGSHLEKQVRNLRNRQGFQGQEM